MTAVALLKATPKPTDTNIEESMGGNICRCGTYVRIREAIRIASQHGAPSTAKHSAKSGD
jgi:isoquinoline 1-oxidoreductase alpha subunit